MRYVTPVKLQWTDFPSRFSVQFFVLKQTLVIALFGIKSMPAACTYLDSLFYCFNNLSYPGQAVNCVKLCLE